MAELKLSLRTHRSRISSIIKDGFKNSFEVEPTAWWMTQPVDDFIAGSSKDYYLTRKSAEFNAFNIPFEAEAADRPIYGFARMSDDFTTAVGGQTSYGNVVINLKQREGLQVIASGGRERVGIGDTLNLTVGVLEGDGSTKRFAVDETTGRIITHTLPLRETLEEGRIISTGISGSVNLNMADRIGPSSGAQLYESVPIPQRPMPKFLDEVSSLVQGTPKPNPDKYVELSFFDRLKAGDIESIDIIRRPFDTEYGDAPEALKVGLHSMNGEEASARILQGAREDMALAFSLRSQLDEMGLSHIPIRTGTTVPIYGVNAQNQDLMSRLESLSGFKHQSGFVGERTVFDTTEKTAEQLMGIDRLLASDEFKGLSGAMIPSRAFDVKNIESGTGVFTSLIDGSAEGARAASASISSATRVVAEEAAEKVVQEGSRVLGGRTLSGILEAGEVAAKVMRFKV